MKELKSGVPELQLRSHNYFRYAVPSSQGLSLLHETQLRSDFMCAEFQPHSGEGHMMRRDPSE